MSKMVCSSTYPWSYDLVVNEQEMKELLESLTNKSDRINNAFNDYLKALEKAKDSAFVSGETHEAICNFYTLAKELDNVFSDVVKLVNLNYNNFILEIDKKDKYLY